MNLKTVFQKGVGKGRRCLFYTTLAAGSFYCAATTNIQQVETYAEQVGVLTSIVAGISLVEKLNDPTGKKSGWNSTFLM